MFSTLAWVVNSSLLPVKCALDLRTLSQFPLIFHTRSGEYGNVGHVPVKFCTNVGVWRVEVGRDGWTLPVANASIEVVGDVTTGEAVGVWLVPGCVAAKVGSTVCCEVGT